MFIENEDSYFSFKKVTTACPVLEPSPPSIAENTVLLSLLALHYEAKKLACYISDDGIRLLTSRPCP
ncbi:unnamed protein product [Trifolium pratense]|uniref:Uncharacterized protein n=1 Tax=Trifolium pratense TaxID=57577 RepID=A0ACB0KIN1_TRIPR|nr:unnamed protein product [Trifolium pratense]